MQRSAWTRESCRKSMTSFVFISAFNARLARETATITQAVGLCNSLLAAANWYFTKCCFAPRMVREKFIHLGCRSSGLRPWRPHVFNFLNDAPAAAWSWRGWAGASNPLTRIAESYYKLYRLDGIVTPPKSCPQQMPWPS
jgi:hypothetical protein